MIKIKVKCFSQVKYSLGVDELTFELEDGTSVSDLEKIVREKALGKLNTDSKLTDFIKKKMPK